MRQTWFPVRDFRGYNYNTAQNEAFVRFFHPSPPWWRKVNCVVNVLSVNMTKFRRIWEILPNGSALFVYDEEG